MSPIHFTPANCVGLRSILNYLGMENRDMVATFQDQGQLMTFGQIRSKDGRFGHLNQVCVSAVDTGETTVYAAMVCPAGQGRWYKALKTESLFEVCYLIAEKVVR